MKLVLVALAALVVVLSPAGAAAKRPKPGGGGGGGTSTTPTWVKNYANVVNGAEVDLTPEDVQATPDGGALSLAVTQSGTGAGVGWLLRTNAVGATQWQEEIGCLTGAPGDYADELSLQPTGDGGFVLAGGTIGCGSGVDCPELTGLQCGLVEKVGATGALAWARVYSAGADGTVLNRIATTSDGGFVAAGDATDANHDTGGLVLKLDGAGNVQWQRELGPTGTAQLFLKAVQQTADGGYVAAGELDDGSSTSTGLPVMSVFVVKLDAAGNVSWQREFAGTGAVEHVTSLVQTADGGYAIGGNWNSTSGPGTCCEGALLLQLDAAGAIVRQTAYTEGVRCIDTGFAVMCSALGGEIYSLHQTADGGFVLAGDANLQLSNESPLVPWLAKVGGDGALVWQEQDYQSNASTGAPLSEYFASSALTPEGPLALGFTENPTSGKGELLGVQTDANGTVGTCSQIHMSAALSATDPGLAAVSPALTVTTPATSTSSAPVQTLATSATATPTQC